MALTGRSSSGPTTTILLVGPSPSAIGGVSSYARTVSASSKRRLEHLDIWPIDRAQGSRWGISVVLFHVLLALRLAKRARSVDIVHLLVTSAPAALVRETLLALVARLSGAKVVCHYHGGNFRTNAAASRIYRIALRITLRAGHVAVMLSPHMARDFTFLGAGLRYDAKIVPNPVADEFFGLSLTGPKSRQAPTILCMGEVSERKGQLELTRVVEEMGGQCRLVLAGPIEPAIAYRFRDALSVARFTSYAGLLSGEGQLEAYRDADLYCLFSRAEALPISILEAMAAGLPVVATRVGGVPDVVCDRTGLLIEPGDVNRLSSALTELLRDPESRRARGANGRALAAQRFSMTEHLARLDEVYESAMESVR